MKNKIKPFFNALIGVAILLGIGCQAPPLNFSPADVGLSKQRHSVELKSISVTIAQPKDRKSRNKIDIASLNYYGVTANDITQTWRSAIDDAVLRMGLFTDDSMKKVSILVRINEFDKGIFSAWTIGARYELLDRSNNSILFYTDIKNAGAGFNQWDQINSGVQRNIMQFLQQLETGNIDKPIFPGREKSR